VGVVGIESLRGGRLGLRKATFVLMTVEMGGFCPGKTKTIGQIGFKKEKGVNTKNYYQISKLGKMQRRI